MSNWLGLGSAWVSSQVIFSGYTANNYPRSTFDLVVFGGKFNASGVIVEIVLADTFYAFVLEWSFGSLNQLHMCSVHSNQRYDTAF